MNKLEKVFGTKYPRIGMIHFPPLLGYADYPGFDYIQNKMIDEIKILNGAGFDGIILENNYDIPHKQFVQPEVLSMFTVLSKIALEVSTIPIGVSVLWNDYKAALSICADTGTSFFRVPAFVDTVKTNYGIMESCAVDVIEYRKKLNLDHCLIFADIQVKHSEMVDKNKTLEMSALEAVNAGADVLIVTGKWTGDAPDLKHLNKVRNAVGEFPIIIGSGASAGNIKLLYELSDGVIVGNSIKEGSEDMRETNLKPFNISIDKTRASEFVLAAKNLQDN